MKAKNLFVFFLCLFFCNHSEAQSFQKIYNYGTINHVITLPDSSGYLFTGDIETNTNDRNSLIKTDLLGNRVWGKYYRDFIEFYSWGNVVVAANGGYYLGGMSLNDTIGNQELTFAFVDSTGSLRWSKRMGSEFRNDEVYDILPVANNHFLLCGYTEGYGAGNSDALLIKTDSAGNIDWTFTYGTAAYENGVNILPNGNGFTMFAESFGNSTNQDVAAITIDSSGNIIEGKRLKNLNGLFNRNEQLGQVVKTSDGHFLFVGTSLGIISSSATIFIVETDASFNVLHSFYVNGINGLGKTILKNAAGDYIIGGSIDLGGATNNGLIIQVNASLSSCQATLLGDSALGSLDRMVSVNDTSYVFGGGFTQRPQINPHLWLLNYSASANFCDHSFLPCTLQPFSVSFDQDTAFSSQSVILPSSSALVVTYNLNQADTNACDVVSIPLLEKEENLCSLFPNPAVNEISIESAEPLLTVRIFDITGKEVVAFHQKHATFELAPGCYSVLIETVYHHRFSRKLIVK